MRLLALDFVAVSFDTANDDPASVCAVGLVRIRNGVMIDRYASFITYPRSLGGFDAYHTELHKIAPKDLIGAPTWRDVLPRIVDFIGDDYVVAHNAEFDSSVITAACAVAGSKIPNVSFLCSRVLAKKAISLPKYRLADVAEALHLGDFGTHDTEANALVSALICTHLAEREELATLNHLMGQYGVREVKLGLGRGFAAELPPVDHDEVLEEPLPPVPARRRREAFVAAEVEAEAVKEVVQPVAVESAAETADVSAAPLVVSGQRISFVGGFDPEERALAKQLIPALGGKYLKNVRPDTTLLVMGVHHNPNLEGFVTARTFNDQGSNIRFVNKDEFMAALR